MEKRFIRTASNIWDSLLNKTQYKDSIVFIEDTKQIWSNDVYYGGNKDVEKILFETESITLQPNKFYYNPNAISSLDISLDFEEGVTNTYFVEFRGTNVSLLLPSYIRWENDIIPDFSKSYYKYALKIQDNVAYLIDKILDESLIPNYFYIESRENSNVINLGSGTWLYTKRSQVEYSIDKINWNPLNITSYILNEGEKMYFRCVEGNIEKDSTITNPLLKSSETFNIGGDISTVIYGEENIQTINNKYAMYYLFYDTKVVDASKLLLPATTLTDSCYYDMFSGCTSLITAPELPATKLADNCYYCMFTGCDSLITAPELPATTLASHCYQDMFAGCDSLTAAPELPVMTLLPYCYSGMFNGCDSLTAAPELPAMILAESCYNGMFSYCTSLTTAPELPATTLTPYCYNYMFAGCTNLNYIKCLATDKSASRCTHYWVNGVSNTGTFVKHPNVTWSTGTSGIPIGWEVVGAEL